MNTHTVSFRHLEKDIKKSLNSDQFIGHLHKSAQAISQIAVRALQTEGAPGWTADLPYFKDIQDRTKLEKTLAPLTDWWIGFVEDTNRRRHSGGGDVSGCPQVPEPEPTDYSIDGMYDAAIQQIQRVNDTTQEFASKYGILAFEKSYDDQETDPYPLASIGYALTPIFPPAKVLADIPIPARAITTVIYTILDVLRVSLVATGTESPAFRKILSLTLALADFLRGDWKKALMSFAGFYGANYVMFGFFGKMFMDVFSLINPDLQMAIVYGTKDFIKSLIAGSLLFIYQIAAPAVARQPLAEYFVEVETAVQKRRASERSQHPDAPAGAELKIVPPYLVPTFQHIQNLQAALGSPITFCPLKENILKMVGAGAADPNWIMTLFFQLLNIPTTAEKIDEECGKWEEKTRNISRGTEQATQVNSNIPNPPPNSSSATNSVPTSSPAAAPPPPPQPQPQRADGQTPGTPAEIPKNSPPSPPLPQGSAAN